MFCHELESAFIKYILLSSNTNEFIIKINWIEICKMKFSAIVFDKKNDLFKLSFRLLETIIHHPVLTNLCLNRKRKVLTKGNRTVYNKDF